MGKGEAAGKGSGEGWGEGEGHGQGRAKNGHWNHGVFSNCSPVGMCKFSIYSFIIISYFDRHSFHHLRTNLSENNEFRLSNMLVSMCIYLRLGRQTWT